MSAAAAVPPKPAPAVAVDASPFHWIDADQILAPLQPTKWIVPGLQLCPGRPATVIGFGSSAKTLACQAMLLSCAIGSRVWDRFDVPTPLRVRHIDYDQGRHATLKRYQGLAVGLGVGAEQLRGRLDVSSFPTLYLNDDGAEDAYARAADGVDFILVDALKGAVPGEDENDSAIRHFLDRLTRVSERTGAAFVMIHHASKPKEGGTDPRYVGRGSGGIFDASGCQLVIVSERNQPRIVTQSKQPAEVEGGKIDDFELVVRDVPDGASPTAGLRVVARAVSTARTSAGPKSKDERLADLSERVAACVTENAGCSGKKVCGEVKGADTAIYATLGRLVDVGRIKRVGEGADTAYWPVEVDS